MKDLQVRQDPIALTREPATLPVYDQARTAIQEWNEANRSHPERQIPLPEAGESLRLTDLPPALATRLAGILPGVQATSANGNGTVDLHMTDDPAVTGHRYFAADVSRIRFEGDIRQPAAPSSALPAGDLPSTIVSLQQAGYQRQNLFSTDGATRYQRTRDGHTIDLRVRDVAGGHEIRTESGGSRLTHTQTGLTSMTAPTIGSIEPASWRYLVRQATTPVTRAFMEAAFELHAAGVPVADINRILQAAWGSGARPMTSSVLTASLRGVAAYARMLHHLAGSSPLQGPEVSRAVEAMVRQAPANGAPEFFRDFLRNVRANLQPDGQHFDARAVRVFRDAINSGTVADAAAVGLRSGATSLDQIGEQTSDRSASTRLDTTTRALVSRPDSLEGLTYTQTQLGGQADDLEGLRQRLAMDGRSDLAVYVAAYRDASRALAQGDLAGAERHLATMAAAQGTLTQVPPGWNQDDLDGFRDMLALGVDSLRGLSRQAAFQTDRQAALTLARTRAAQDPGAGFEVVDRGWAENGRHQGYAVVRIDPARVEAQIRTVQGEGHGVFLAVQPQGGPLRTVERAHASTLGPEFAGGTQNNVITTPQQDRLVETMFNTMRQSAMRRYEQAETRLQALAGDEMMVTTMVRLAQRQGIGAVSSSLQQLLGIDAALAGRLAQQFMAIATALHGQDPDALHRDAAVDPAQAPPTPEAVRAQALMDTMLAGSDYGSLRDTHRSRTEQVAGAMRELRNAPADTGHMLQLWNDMPLLREEFSRSLGFTFNPNGTLDSHTPVDSLAARVFRDRMVAQGSHEQWTSIAETVAVIAATTALVAATGGTAAVVIGTGVGIAQGVEGYVAAVDRAETTGANATAGTVPWETSREADGDVSVAAVMGFIGVATGPLQGVFSGANPSLWRAVIVDAVFGAVQSGADPRTWRGSSTEALSSIVLAAGFSVAGGLGGRVFHGSGGTPVSGDDLAGQRLNLHLHDDGRVVVEGSEGVRLELAHARHVDGPDGRHFIEGQDSTGQVVRLSVGEGGGPAAMPHEDAAGAGSQEDPMAGIAPRTSPVLPAAPERLPLFGPHEAVVVQIDGQAVQGQILSTSPTGAEVFAAHEPSRIMAGLGEGATVGVLPASGAEVTFRIDRAPDGTLQARREMELLDSHFTRVAPPGEAPRPLQAGDRVTTADGQEFVVQTMTGRRAFVTGAALEPLSAIETVSRGGTVEVTPHGGARRAYDVSDSGAIRWRERVTRPLGDVQGASPTPAPLPAEQFDTRFPHHPGDHRQAQTTVVWEGQEFQVAGYDAPTGTVRLARDEVVEVVRYHPVDLPGIPEFAGRTFDPLTLTAGATIQDAAGSNWRILGNEQGSLRLAPSGGGATRTVSPHAGTGFALRGPAGFSDLPIGALQPGQVVTVGGRPYEVRTAWDHGANRTFLRRPQVLEVPWRRIQPVLDTPGGVLVTRSAPVSSVAPAPTGRDALRYFFSPGAHVPISVPRVGRQHVQVERSVPLRVDFDMAPRPVDAGQSLNIDQLPVGTQIAVSDVLFPTRYEVGMEGGARALIVTDTIPAADVAHFVTGGPPQVGHPVLFEGETFTIAAVQSNGDLSLRRTVAPDTTSHTQWQSEQVPIAAVSAALGAHPTVGAHFEHNGIRYVVGQVDAATGQVAVGHRVPARTVPIDGIALNARGRATITVQAPGGPPRSVQVRGMQVGGSTVRSVVDPAPVASTVHTIRVGDGASAQRIQVAIPDLPNGQPDSARLADIQAMLAQMPTEFAGAQGYIRLNNNDNWQDFYWRRIGQFGPDGRSAATAGGGATLPDPVGAASPTGARVTDFYRSGTDHGNFQERLGTLYHESGHQIARQLWGETSGRPNRSDTMPAAQWQSAMTADGAYVSQYAQSNPAEDFAETVRVYLETDGGRTDPAMRERFLSRFEALDGLFGVDANTFLAHRVLQENMARYRVGAVAAGATVAIGGGLAAGGYVLYDAMTADEAPRPAATPAP